MKISNGSKKRCRKKFQYKGIGRTINDACQLIETLGKDTVIAEFIYDYYNVELYNVLLFLLKENDNTKELDIFDYE